jgi:hypothetical protein
MNAQELLARVVARDFADGEEQHIGSLKVRLPLLLTRTQPGKHRKMEKDRLRLANGIDVLGLASARSFGAKRVSRAERAATPRTLAGLAPE